jgi:beta-galactosidase
MYNNYIGTDHTNGKAPNSVAIAPTSYDYDALISEAGDLTEKYFAMKKIIAKYLPIPNIPVEKTVPKGDYGSVKMFHVIDIYSLKNTPLVERLSISEFPMTFEQLNQENGFVLYEHIITKQYRDPSVLTVTGTRISIYILNKNHMIN